MEQTPRWGMCCHRIRHRSRLYFRVGEHNARQLNESFRIICAIPSITLDEDRLQRSKQKRSGLSWSGWTGDGNRRGNKTFDYSFCNQHYHYFYLIPAILDRQAERHPGLRRHRHNWWSHQRRILVVGDVEKIPQSFFPLLQPYL